MRRPCLCVNVFCAFLGSARGRDALLEVSFRQLLAQETEIGSLRSGLDFRRSWFDLDEFLVPDARTVYFRFPNETFRPNLLSDDVDGFGFELVLPVDEMHFSVEASASAFANAFDVPAMDFFRSESVDHCTDFVFGHVFEFHDFSFYQLRFKRKLLTLHLEMSNSSLI